MNPCDRSGRVSVKARRVISYGRYKAEGKVHIKLKCDLHHKTIHYNRRKIKRLVLTAGMRCHPAVFFCPEEDNAGQRVTGLRECQPNIGIWKWAAGTKLI